MQDFKGEKLEKNLKSKEVFYYYDDEKKTKQISREVFKNNDEVIHYPRGIDDPQKYTNIQKIRFMGFDGKLPVGVIKSAKLGYGFTRTLGKFAAYVDKELGIKEVIIEKQGKVDLDKDKKKLYLSERSLRTLQTSFSALYDRHRAQVRSQIVQNLYALFKAKFPKPKAKYTPGTIAAELAIWGNSLSEFSYTDKSAIQSLFDKLSITGDFLTDEVLTRTKQLVDSKYIQEVLAELKSLMSVATENANLEKKWQDFLRRNTWVFSSIFAQPVILHKQEAYVGGKNIENADGKVTDFLIKNDLSNNVSFLEIKTHKTNLLEAKPYRGSDVFSSSKDLTGSISQVLNQRDSFQKEYYGLKGKSEVPFETLNSKCVVLIGSMSSLSKKQKASFELQRNNSRDVEILTFDELEKKIEALQTLVEKGPPKRGRK